MKKVIAVFFTVLLVSFIVACGGKDVEEGGNSFGGGTVSTGKATSLSLSEYVKEYNNV